MRSTCDGRGIVRKGDTTTTGGLVLEGVEGSFFVHDQGSAVAVKGHKVSCPACKRTGVIAEGSTMLFVGDNQTGVALDGHIVACGCPYGSHRLIAKASPGSVGNDAYSSQYLSGASSMYTRASDTPVQPDYPVLRNTQDFPDENLRGMLSQNNQDVMLITISEAFEVLQSWGWNDTKTVWVETTQSDVGQVLVNYGVNGKDVVTTSMIISKLGSFGIKATVYINHKGTELIKLTGYPGIRRVLNAPVFALKNPKVVDLGIGKYGLGKSIIKGARLTFYVAAAYRTIDFILNDETHLAQFIGPLATDVAKIGIASAISWGAGAAAVAYVPFISAPLVVVVGFGFLAAWGLNKLDSKFGITDKVVAYIEAAQQEFVDKAREIEQGLWDLGAMYADRMLDKGKEVIEYEIKRYLRDSINNIIPRIY